MTEKLDTKLDEIENGEDFSRKPMMILSLSQKYTTKTKKPYVEMSIGDRKNKFIYRIWETLLNALEVTDPVLEVNKMYYVSGKRKDFRMIPQLEDLSFETMPADDKFHSETLYVESAPEELKSMVEQIDDYIKEIESGDEEYATLVKDILTMKQHLGTRFSTQPAALNIHHNFKSGLIYHTLRMLEQAKALSSVYEIDTTLLYTAIILHDTGKMLEYSGYKNNSETIFGELLGHISIVDGWISAWIEKQQLNAYEEKWVVLRHVVLAHHGRLEWGSPVEPIVPEAMLINMIDMTDAKMMQFETNFEKMEPDTLSSNKVFGLGNKKIFKAANK